MAESGTETRWYLLWSNHNSMKKSALVFARKTLLLKFLFLLVTQHNYMEKV